MITFRQTIEADTPALLEILSATDLHCGSRWDDCSGWVGCADGKAVGFGLADSKTGGVVVVAVLPDFVGQGIGRDIMKQAEAWLFSHGWNEISLTLPEKTDGRTTGFFHHLGWSDWKAEAGERDLKKANPRTTICLEEHSISDDATGYTRLVRLQRAPADIPHRLFLFLDGEHYWRDMDAVPLLNSLLERGDLPPMTFAFIGHVSAKDRVDDYTCNEQYARFISDAVMPWLKNEIPWLLDGGHLIGGLSLSGLMAVYQTLRNPEHFTSCLSQSGSHWWKHHWFAEMAAKQAPRNSRFWLSVGDQEVETNVDHGSTGLVQEISQIAGVEKAVETLVSIEGSVHFNKYHGGHSLACWRDELDAALHWLLAGKKT